VTVSLGGRDVSNAQLLQSLCWIKKLINNPLTPVQECSSKSAIDDRHWYEIFTASVNETNGRSAACQMSEETTAVYVRRLTEYVDADHKKYLISTIATPLSCQHTQWMAFQCSEPSMFWSQYTRRSIEKLRTIRYRTVIRDQRCLCPGLDALSCNPLICDSAHPDQFKL
jgi:hypothetical protein